MLNEYSCNTNVAGIWMAQYKYTTIKWEGALNSQHMLLGTRLVTSIFENNFYDLAVKPT